MGIYLNQDNRAMSKKVASKIYIDKSNLIEYTNSVFDTDGQYICVSRPRRFGKTMAADMLVAYYSKGCDSSEIFGRLNISKSDDYEKHLNKYNCVHINMHDVLNHKNGIEAGLSEMESLLLRELKAGHPNVEFYNLESLVISLQNVFEEEKIPFVFIIDEWDCVFRINKERTDEQTKYLEFLRGILKDKDYVGLAYMTGILPIKKYGINSALNMFTEISMIKPQQLAEFTGFTEQEVIELCEKHDMSFEDIKSWYNGYYLGGQYIYNPCSVVNSMLTHIIDDYWVSTETYEALSVYIDMDFEGLKECVLRLMAGERQEIETQGFANDLISFANRDNILTLLVHIGYLGYDKETSEVFIPNREILTNYKTAVVQMEWSIANALKASKELLKATLALDNKKVAEQIDLAHEKNVSLLEYNDENSMSCVISLAYYAAREYYVLHREMPSGKGFADIVFIPRPKFADKPALVIELKYDKSVEAAISQIKNKNYVNALKDYTGEILLVGINYDKDSKKHECLIEEYVME